QQTQAQLEPEPEPEPEPEQTVTPSPVRVQPVYVPTPRGRTRARSVTALRKQAHTLRLQAASAPSSVSGFPGSGSSTQAQPQVTGENTAPTAANPAINTPVDANADAMANLMQQNAAENDPNGWARKEAFLKQSLPAEYSQYTRTFPVSALELKAGSLFPCVLISGINSDLPGNIIAQVSENVYDTATGRYLLVPRGSRLIGTYDHQISTGQNRVLVVWSRLIFPDGSSLVLDNLQGADQSGFSGFKGTVNRHWNVMLTSALLVALIGAGVEAASPSNSGSVFSNNDKSVGAILRERTATAIADVLTQVIRKNINRQPTILIKPGYRFMIFAQHDIVFPRIWNERLGR
ncbi:MAG: TrbI/VirB10 family protein, partial [Synergistaceae bacterium]|nr:TrbI/VirB10 family protein [Synergistaceae bacterium]